MGGGIGMPTSIEEMLAQLFGMKAGSHGAGGFPFDLDMEIKQKEPEHMFADAELVGKKAEVGALHGLVRFIGEELSSLRSELSAKEEEIKQLQEEVMTIEGLERSISNLKGMTERLHERNLRGRQTMSEMGERIRNMINIFGSAVVATENLATMINATTKKNLTKKELISMVDKIREVLASASPQPPATQAEEQAGESAQE